MGYQYWVGLRQTCLARLIRDARRTLRKQKPGIGQIRRHRPQRATKTLPHGPCPTDHRRVARLLCPLHPIDDPASRQKRRSQQIHRPPPARDRPLVGLPGETRGVAHEQPCRADAALCRMLAQEKLRHRQRQGQPLGGTDSVPVADLSVAEPGELFRYWLRRSIFISKNENPISPGFLRREGITPVIGYLSCNKEVLCRLQEREPRHGANHLRQYPGQKKPHAHGHRKGQRCSASSNNGVKNHAIITPTLPTRNVTQAKILVCRL